MIDNLYYKTRGDLEALIREMAWNDSMGCHTRGGFEKWVWKEVYARATHIVYFDVNGVHQLNEQAGTYDVFDAKIKKVLSAVRSTDIVAGQFNSGDEFVICLLQNYDRNSADPDGLVHRLTEELAKQELTAIFAVTAVTSSIFMENVKPAADQVLAAKKARGITR